jgi:integrase/recombinase XerD
MTTTPITLLQQISSNLGTHRSTPVIWCKFPYNALLLAEFKKEFPSAAYSATHKAWYVPDTTLYRKRLNIAPQTITTKVLSGIHVVNQSYPQLLHNKLTQIAYSPSTIKTYTGELAQFLSVLKAYNAKDLTTAQLNAYFLYCIKTLKHSENKIHSHINALRFFYDNVLKLPHHFMEVPRPKKANLLPKVLSKQDVKKIFTAVQNPKHLLMLQLCYGMGLRVSEVVNLKITNIDSARMQVHIQASKGKKDRYVNLPQNALELLRAYYKEYKPKNYLFEGQFADQYSKRSVQAVFKRAMTTANINKTVGIHGLRHSYATHLLEVGTDISLIQKLLGHNDLKTTLIYTKVSTKLLSNVVSPLDSL